MERGREGREGKERARREREGKGKGRDCDVDGDDGDRGGDGDDDRAWGRETGTNGNGTSIESLLYYFPHIVSPFWTFNTLKAPWRRIQCVALKMYLKELKRKNLGIQTDLRTDTYAIFTKKFRTISSALVG